MFKTCTQKVDFSSYVRRVYAVVNSTITIDYQRWHPYVEGSNKVASVQVHHVFLIHFHTKIEKEKKMDTKIKKVKFSLQKQKTTLGRKLSTMSTAAVTQLRKNQSTDSFRRNTGHTHHVINYNVFYKWSWIDFSLFLNQRKLIRGY